MKRIALFAVLTCLFALWQFPGITKADQPCPCQANGGACPCKPGECPGDCPATFVAADEQWEIICDNGRCFRVKKTAQKTSRVATPPQVAGPCFAPRFPVLHASLDRSRAAAARVVQVIRERPLAHALAHRIRCGPHRGFFRR